MATVKLSTYLRSKILIRLLRHRFGAEVQALVDDFKIFAKDLYLEICKEDLKVLNSSILRPGMLPKTSSISARFGNYGNHYDTIRFNGNAIGGDLSVCLPENHSWPNVELEIPYNFYQGCAGAFNGAHPLSERYNELLSRKEELRRRKIAAEHQINLALNKATTVAKLVEIWPEVRPFVTDMLKAPPAPPLPAIPVEALNKALDLPVDETRKAA